MPETNEPTEPTHRVETRTGSPPPVWPPGRAIAWLTAAVAVLALVVVGVAGVAFGRSTTGGDPPDPTITVTGSGTVKGVPDTCSFTIGVNTVRSTAVLALQANNAQMTALEHMLRDAGVPIDDLQTTNLAIYQETNAAGVVTGWAVDDTLDVTVHDIAHAGQIIDAAAKVTGNDITFGGVTFSISNDSSLLAAARREAMQSAMTEASQLASGANQSVTGIEKVTASETTSVSPPFPFFGLAARAASAVPLAAGRQPVSVQVTVVYTLS